ncbi:energy coupling factor transporter S component ThiW [Domibacillus sp. A3M-37]|uniref:energy coupling factor transporter S component ThiW n=1 Tax=Domibacillus sp. A3M-37 TaxID=2962037 RepID=UPI0021138573|nr:energy coupling factor transporter S component ThiW [Domibacillus sp. A3M-37]
MLMSVPIANLFLGMEAAAFAFMPTFLISSVTGSILGLLLAVRLKKQGCLIERTDSNE